MLERSQMNRVSGVNGDGVGLTHDTTKDRAVARGFESRLLPQSNQKWTLAGKDIFWPSPVVWGDGSVVGGNLTDPAEHFGGIVKTAR
jgi:hypothetical protein